MREASKGFDERRGEANNETGLLCCRPPELVEEEESACTELLKRHIRLLVDEMGEPTLDGKDERRLQATWGRREEVAEEVEMGIFVVLGEILLLKQRARYMKNQSR